MKDDNSSIEGIEVIENHVLFEGKSHLAESLAYDVFNAFATGMRKKVT